MVVRPPATEPRPARMGRRPALTARRRTAVEGRRALTGHRRTGAAGRRAVTVHLRAATVHRPAHTARLRTAVEGRPAATAPPPSEAAAGLAVVTGSPPAMAHPRAAAAEAVARYPRATVHPPGEVVVARPPPTVHPTEEAMDTRDHLPLTVHLAPVVAVSEAPVDILEAEVVTLEVEMATLEAAEAAIQGGMAAIQGGMAATPEAEVVVKATLATVVTNINREQPSPSAAILDRHVVSPRFIETRKDLPPPLRHPPPTNSSERSGEPLCPRFDGQTAVDETTKGGRIEDGSRGDRRPWIEPPPSQPQQASRKSGKVKKTVSKTV